MNSTIHEKDGFVIPSLDLIERRNIPYASTPLWVLSDPQKNRDHTALGKHLLAAGRYGMQGLSNERSGQRDQSQTKDPMKSKHIPGLGYESGGYAPFLTTSLSTHVRADALRSSEAVPGTETSTK